MIDSPATQASSWSAHWCWTQRHAPRPWNSYACFRKLIELAGAPRRAQVRISADARYILYVNGRRIHQGPARCYPNAQVYDTLDITHALHPGPNVIAAVVHQFGAPTFFSVYRDASGLLIDGVIELHDHPPVPVHTPDGWLCRDARAWRKDVARLSIQLGFQEHFDADQDTPGWLLPDYEASDKTGWTPPHDRGPAGVHPWLLLEPRTVPLLADHVIQFQRIVAQFSGENTRGYKIAEDVYHLPLMEQRRHEKNLLENPDAMLRDDGEITTVAAPEDGHFTMVVLDLGGVRAGHPILDIAGAAGDEIIDLIYTETVDKSDAPMLIAQDSKSHSKEATADRYRCRPGPQRWEPFHLKGFRYLTLIFRNVEKPLHIRHVGVRRIHADVKPLGSFECSDAQLNAIWQASRETQLNCLLDAFVDCPWREQAMWWGDARIQARVTQFAFGDTTFLERGLRLVAQSQAADGSLHAHPPADIPAHRLPDFMLTWVLSLWDHYLYTGRTDVLKECAATLHRVMGFFDSRTSAHGLIGSFSGFWVFLDWATLPKEDFCATLNLMYLQALRAAAEICTAIGAHVDANRYTKTALALSIAIERCFWDAKESVWRDRFDPATKSCTDSTSQHANALAILLDLRSQDEEAIARDVLVKSARSRRGRIVTASPFFYSYVFDALVAAGNSAEVIEIIRDKWGRMLEQGGTTFWEVFEPEHHSRCHAWSASPLYHITQIVLGVTPAAAGWTQVRIAPVPLKLEYARGAIPTPLGLMRVDWEQVSEDQLVMRIELPEGMRAEFVSPSSARRTLGPGIHEFHT